MSDDVVVVGGGVAGLAVALLLNHAGVGVTVVEPEPVVLGPVDDTTAWNRRGVPQRGNGHAFHGLSRRILAARAPEVLSSLTTAGVTERRFDLAIPIAQRLPEDNELVALQSRRVVFENALRAAVARESAVSLVEGRVRAVTGAAGAAAGVELVSGERISSAWVIDASGQRSVRAQLTRGLVRTAPTVRRQPAATAYYARHFRRISGTGTTSSDFHFGPTGDLGFLRYSVLDEDSGWFVVTLNTPSSDHELRVLSDPDAWDRAAAAIPGLAPWVAARVAKPRSGVFSYAGRGNVLVEATPETRPARLAMLGDSLCQTNPTQGWGVSLALRQAEIVADAIARGLADPVGSLLAYVTPFYEAAAAEDRERSRIAAGVDVDPTDPRSPLFLRKSVSSLGAADVEVYRANQRRIHLLDDPRTLPADITLMERARRLVTAQPSAPEVVGPTRERLLQVVRETSAGFRPPELARGEARAHIPTP